MFLLIFLMLCLFTISRRLLACPGQRGPRSRDTFYLNGSQSCKRWDERTKTYKFSWKKLSKKV